MAEFIFLDGKISVLESILLKVKYFTADITSTSHKSDRQRTYLSALKNVCGDNLEIIKGQYLTKNFPCPTHRFQMNQGGGLSPNCTNYQCQTCNGIIRVPEEKKTDVNIATTMLFDAFKDKFDVAFLVSGDTDLVPPVDIITKFMPSRKVIIISPPHRGSWELKKLVGTQRCRQIKEFHLKNSTLPPTITTDKGGVIVKPLRWN